MTEVLGIVPARGGSKGLPRKNLARIGGRSLVGWAVAAALESRSCTRVVVSTDSEEVADEARRCGAEVPFMRPDWLSADSTPGIAPVLHAVRWMDEQLGYRPEWVLLLQPTSPLRTAEDIDAAFELAAARSADGVVSVTPAPVHPYLAKTIAADGRLRDFMAQESAVTRRQELPEVYVLNGAIYLTRREALLARESLYTESTLGYVMPAERSVDVDTELELRIAELVLQRAAEAR